MHKTLPWKSADNYCFYLDIFIQHCHFYPRSVISGWVSAILSLRVSRCFKNCRLCRQGRGEVSPGGPVQLIRQGGRGKAGVGPSHHIINHRTATLLLNPHQWDHSLYWVILHDLTRPAIITPSWDLIWILQILHPTNWLKHSLWSFFSSPYTERQKRRGEGGSSVLIRRQWAACWWLQWWCCRFLIVIISYLIV